MDVDVPRSAVRSLSTRAVQNAGNASNKSLSTHASGPLVDFIARTEARLAKQTSRPIAAAAPSPGHSTSAMASASVVQITPTTYCFEGDDVERSAVSSAAARNGAGSRRGASRKSIEQPPRTPLPLPTVVTSSTTATDWIRQHTAPLADGCAVSPQPAAQFSSVPRTLADRAIRLQGYRAASALARAFEVAPSTTKILESASVRLAPKLF